MYDELDFMQNEPDKISKILNGDLEITDAVDLEDLLLEINRLDRDVTFFRKLKKKRVQPIDERVKEYESKISKIREIVFQFMDDSGDSKLDFPDVAKVLKRKKSGHWQVEDEEKLVKSLSKMKLLGDVAEQNWKFDKKKLSAMLNDLKENNNLCDGVIRTEDEQTISITFYKEATEKSKEVENKKNTSFNNIKPNEDIDSIVI